MSDAARESVRSLLLPLQGNIMLVLPNAAVAEVVPFRNPDPVEGAGPWLLGTVSWRDQKMPLVAFDALGGEAPAEARRGAQLVIMHGVTAPDRLPYYALLASSIPHLIQVVEESIHSVADGEAEAHVLCHVTFGDQRAIIPNLDVVEGSLLGT